MITDVGIAEKIGSATNRNNEVIILEITNICRYKLRVPIDRFYICHPDLHIGFILEDISQRKGNSGRFDLRSRDLIKQGVKLMVIELVPKKYIEKFIVPSPAH